MKMVYLSPVPWLSISQRPHFFVREALHQNINEVLWIDPYPGRLPGLQDLLPGRHAAEPSGMITPPQGLTILNIKGIWPVEPFGRLFDIINNKKLSNVFESIDHFVGDDKCLLVIGKPSRLALELMSKNQWYMTWFDAMDNYPAFYQSYSRSSMEKLECKLAASVDKITCSSHALAEKYSQYDCVSIIQNATADYISIQNDMTQKCDDYLYIGTIASWIDWDWIVQLASEHNTSIHMYGPVKSRIPSSLSSNIKLFEPLPHDRINELLGLYKTAIIPFKNNEITRYVDPVKFYEYKAAGLNVISTNFGEMLWHYNEHKKIGLPSYFDKGVNIIFFENSNDAILERNSYVWPFRLKGVFND